MRYRSIPRNVSLIAYIVLALLFLSLSSVSAATVIRLSWDPNTEPDLARYYLKYGTTSQVYTDFIDVGNVTSYDVMDLPAGTTQWPTLRSDHRSYALGNSNLQPGHS